MALKSPHNFKIDPYIKSALEEDISFFDISTDLVSKPNSKLKATLNSREEGILCGIEVFKRVFEIIDDSIEVKLLLKDGDKITKGNDIAIIKGNARTILTGERLALNFIQRMSAIATNARRYQDAIKPHKAKVVDTRKTTPNFRIFEKYAVSIGNNGLHRFNLSDCVMLKDNHIALVGSITKAVETVRESLSHSHKIEVEVDTIKQMKEALNAGVDIIMLDNMSIEDMKYCVEYIDGKAITEASGGISLETINKIASTGVDIISTSAIQAKAGSLDLGLDIK